MSSKQRGPAFLRYMQPIIETLKELGNSGTASEVTERVIERLGISDVEAEETTPAGQHRVRNRIHWARFYLSKAGYLDSSSGRGVWALTEKGRNAALDSSAVLELFKNVHKRFPKRDLNRPSVAVATDVEDEPPDADDDHRARLLAILRALPAPGFERVCQRLLRESGFQQVIITGRAGDGGIDGHGVLEINPLVTFRILFQCKRYGHRQSVTPSHVRDFRGAMQGRADKGLILTTGTFTTEAKREATRDGVPPIEMVDADKLVEMFERAELGLRPIRAFEIDDHFFEEFRK